MSLLKFRRTTILICLLATDGVVAQSETEALRTQAQSIVMEFANTLKPRLLEAIAQGGLEHAVQVCASEAPLIADQLAQSSGWSVKRVSLLPRNSLLASPDTFEKNILQQFAAQQASGESGQNMAYSQIDNTRFRFMQAQVVEGLCLNCHGTSIDPELLTVIDRLYPDDIARGYSLGQIRGAISVSKTLVE